MAQLQVLATLVVLALAELGCGLPAEELQPVIRQRRQTVVIKWSEQEVQKVIGGLSLPSVAQYVPGGSKSLSNCLDTPPSSRGVTYSPIIDVAIDLVFGESWSDEEMFAALRQFLNSQLVYEIIQENSIQVDSYTSVGQLLEVIFEDALMEPEVISNQEWYNAINYFQSIITYGGPPPAQVDSVTVNIADILSSFDFTDLNMNLEAVEALEVVLDYLRSTNVLDEFLAEAQWSSFQTRGSCLYALLTWLVSSGATQQVTSSVQVLLPYVLVDSGSGASSIYSFAGSVSGRSFRTGTLSLPSQTRGRSPGQYPMRDRHWRRRSNGSKRFQRVRPRAQRHRQPRHNSGRRQIHRG